jgi:hypothetical protein
MHFRQRLKSLSLLADFSIGVYAKKSIESAVFPNKSLFLLIRTDMNLIYIIL